MHQPSSIIASQWAGAFPGGFSALLLEDVTAHDPRWPALIDTMRRLRKRGRRSIRIVDVNCGDGMLPLRAVEQARALGFLSIEGVGPDCRSERIVRAQERAIHVRDSAIGLEFTVCEPSDQLEAEAEFPADIVLYQAGAQNSLEFVKAVGRASDAALRHSPASGDRYL